MTTNDYAVAQRALFRAVASGATEVTVVPVRNQYVGVARCLTIVHFLDSALASAIESHVIAPLRIVAPMHCWYRSTDLHITVKNIRAARVGFCASPEELRASRLAFMAMANDRVPTQFQVSEVALFPTSIVVGAFAPATFRDAVRTLGSRLSQAGVPDDKRYASEDIIFANITICRLVAKPSDDLRIAVAQLQSLDLGPYVASGLAL